MSFFPQCDSLSSVVSAGTSVVLFFFNQSTKYHVEVTEMEIERLTSLASRAYTSGQEAPIRSLPLRLCSHEYELDYLLLCQSAIRLVTMQ